jgi:hypothetical protein
MAKSEFIITLKVTMDSREGESGYIHPTGWRWLRAIQRQVPHTTNVEVLNCSPITSDEVDEITDAGWSYEIDNQRQRWEEERG